MVIGDSPITGATVFTAVCASLSESVCHRGSCACMVTGKRGIPGNWDARRCSLGGFGVDGTCGWFEGIIFLAFWEFTGFPLNALEMLGDSNDGAIFHNWCNSVYYCLLLFVPASVSLPTVFIMRVW